MAIQTLSQKGVVVEASELVALKRKNVIRVLHVDDDPSIQEITKLMLLDLYSGFEIDWACCVDEAFKRLAVGCYDIVVSDYEMPQKNGLQFLKELRTQNEDIPFILFTGKGREEVAINALNSGADAYYNKQGSPETVYGELAHSIKQTVERKKAKALVLQNEIQLQHLLAINKMLDASDKELMDYALEAIAKVTLSQFSFIGLINHDETEMTIHSWSKTVMKECKTISKPIHYPISKAGIWAEPIRQRKPILIDDYSASAQCKKGLPEGHVSIKGFLGVPVFEKERIVAVGAVANKRGLYEEIDVSHVTSLVTDMWRLIQYKVTAGNLRLSEERLKQAEKTSHISHWEWTVPTGALVWGDEHFRIFGLPPETAPSMDNFLSRIHPDDVAFVKQSIEAALKGEPYDIDFRIILPDSVERVLNDKGKVENDLKGKPLRMSGTVHDITESTKTETALKTSEKRHRAISEVMADVVYSCVKPKGKNFTIDWMSGATEKIFGYSCEAIVKRGCFKHLVDPRDLPIFEEKIVGLNPGQKSTCELRIVCADGSTHWIKAFSRVILDGKKPAKHRLFGACENITERKRDELIIKESEIKFRRLFEGMVQGAFCQAADGSLLDVNKSALDIFGLDRNQFLGRTSLGPQWKVMREDGSNLSDEEQPSMIALKTEKPVLDFIAKVFNSKINEWKTISVNAIPEFMNGEITPFQVFVTLHDLTQIKRQQDVLIESYTDYKSLINGMSETAWVIDSSGNFLEVNDRAVEVLGYSREELLSIGIAGIDRNLSREQIDSLIARLSLAKKQIFETVHTRKDGGEIPVEISSSSITYQGKQVILSIARNITERKHLEMKLLQSEEQFRQLFSNMPSGVAIYEASDNAKDFVLKDFNTAAEKIEKIERKKVIGKCVTEVFPDVDQFGIFEVFQRVWRSGQTEYYPEAFYKDDRYPGSWRENWVYKLPNGNIVAIYNDITKRKEAEEHRKILEDSVKKYSAHLKYLVDLRTAQLKDANKRLVKSERLAAIGELSAMIGHDLRNPLAGIKNATYYLKKKGHAISETQYREMLETIEKSISHSDKIINDLLEYSREIHLYYEETTLLSLVEAAIKMVNVPERIQVLNHIKDDTTIRVDSDKIMRVFINLIKNAIDAMPEKGTLEITSCKTKNHIEIAFTDTGTGLTEATLEKLFTPLFTTKAQGMGFGLAICKRMIEAHEGTINVKTVENQGTTFTITLPTKPAYPLKDNNS